jgi:hypothetical protein
MTGPHDSESKAIKIGNRWSVLRVFLIVYSSAFILMLLASVPAPNPYPTVRVFRWVLVLPVLTELASMGCLLARKSGITALTLILLILCFFLYPYSLFWGDEPNSLRRVLEKAVDGVMFLGFSILTNVIVPEVVLWWRRG